MDGGKEGLQLTVFLGDVVGIVMVFSEGLDKKRFHWPLKLIAEGIQHDVDVSYPQNQISIATIAYHCRFRHLAKGLVYENLNVTTGTKMNSRSPQNVFKKILERLCAVVDYNCTVDYS